MKKIFTISLLCLVWNIAYADNCNFKIRCNWNDLSICKKWEKDTPSMLVKVYVNGSFAPAKPDNITFDAMFKAGTTGIPFTSSDCVSGKTFVAVTPLRPSGGKANKGEPSPCYTYGTTCYSTIVVGTKTFDFPEDFSTEPKTTPVTK